MRRIALDRSDPTTATLAGLRVGILAGHLELGGAERQLYYIARALQGAGADAHIYCLTRGEYWEERIRQLGVPVTWVGRHTSRLLRLAEIVRVVKANRPDILQSIHFYTNLYVVGAARLLRIPELGAVRSNALGEVGAHGRLLGPLSLRAPRVLVANSHRGIENAARLGLPRERIRILRNVVDTALFRPQPHPNGTVRLLSVGVRTAKRVDRFLSILARVRERARTPVEGVIIGDGPTVPALRDQARALNLLTGGVRFVGEVPVTAADYGRAEILVLTSNREGTPNVILEAMACSLPVVATVVGDVPELVTSDTGFMRPQEDEAGLVDDIVALVDDEPLRRRMGTRARQLVEDSYALDRLPGALADLYGHVL
jgi:glycosyltransferase involved in cell wall biosynthesis